MTKRQSAENLKRLDARLAREDEDRWLSSRYAPAQVRQKLVALYAFNLELAKVRTIVSEAMLGAIRFQWWRDALGDVMEGKPPRKHDVVLAMGETELPWAACLPLIDGHERAFESADRGDEPEAELMLLAADLLSPGHDWGTHIARLAPVFAAARRGEAEAVQVVSDLPKVPTALRPAISHAVLRFAYADGSRPGPLRKRLAIMGAMLSGKA